MLLLLLLLLFTCATLLTLLQYVAAIIARETRLPDCLLLRWAEGYGQPRARCRRRDAACSLFCRIFKGCERGAALLLLLLSVRHVRCGCCAAALDVAVPSLLLLLLVDMCDAACSLFCRSFKGCDRGAALLLLLLRVRVTVLRVMQVRCCCCCS